MRLSSQQRRSVLLPPLNVSIVRALHPPTRVRMAIRPNFGAVESCAAGRGSEKLPDGGGSCTSPTVIDSADPEE